MVLLVSQHTPFKFSFFCPCLFFIVSKSYLDEATASLNPVPRLHGEAQPRVRMAGVAVVEPPCLLLRLPSSNLGSRTRCVHNLVHIRVRFHVFALVFRRALDEANDALNRATVEGEGERKKGDKSAKEAARKSKELEGVREKAKKAKDEFAGMEEKAFEVCVYQGLFVVGVA